MNVLLVVTADLAGRGRARGAGGAPAVLLQYGLFVQAAFDFLIVAFAIFMVVKAINSMKRKEEAAPAAPPEPSAEVKLLTEIRDSLRKD